MYFWIPLLLLLAIFILDEVLRLSGRPSAGLLRRSLALIFAACFVSALLLVFIELDLEGAAQTGLAWVQGGWSEYPRVMTALLAVLGSCLACIGAARAVDQIALAEPDAPIRSPAGSITMAGLGVVLVIAAYSRL